MKAIVTKFVALVLAVGGLVAPGSALAERAVLVELFTSQGCSSCPPADALLAELAERPGVVAIALHVDYWDYLGWADGFADSVFTTRQHRYTHHSGERMVYTPQMVLDGQHFMIGSDAMGVAQALMAQASADASLEISVARSDHDAETEITLHALTALPTPCEVMLVAVDPMREVTITGGENAGHRLRYVNVARELRVLAEWDGADLTLSVPLPQQGRAALIVQAQGQGPVLGAVWLN